MIPTAGPECRAGGVYDPSSAVSSDDLVWRNVYSRLGEPGGLYRGWGLRYILNADATPEPVSKCVPGSFWIIPDHSGIDWTFYGWGVISWGQDFLPPLFVTRPTEWRAGEQVSEQAGEQRC